MNNYIALTKILFKNSLSSFSSSKKGKIRSRVKNIAFAALIILSLLPVAGMIGAAVWAAYPVLKAIGQEGLMLALGLLMVSMVVFVFGIFYIMSIFYFSKDTEILLPLPLKPSTILAAKFTVTIFYEYITELLFLAPAILAFGIASRAGIAYYIYSLIGFLTLPIIPLIYAGIINLLLMRFTNISKNRDKLRIIGGVAAMLVAILINIKAQSFFSGLHDAEQIKNLILQGNNSLLGLMTGLFPANKLLTLALINSASMTGLVNMLLYLAISMLFMILFLSLGEKLYFAGLVGISETGSKRKKLSDEQFEKSVVMNSVIKSYTMKELKLLFRTPVYFINCVLMNFLWPLFLLIPIFSNSGDGPSLSEVQALVRIDAYEGIILAIAFAGILFASGSNAVASTAVSREGENIYVSKYLPVSYHDQIMSKVLSAVILGMMAMISMLAFAVYLMRLSFSVIICTIITGMLGIFFTSMAGILIDLKFPKLHWDNEQKAVKQNMNAMVAILIATALAAVVVVPSILLKLNLWIVFAALTAIFGFADAVLYGLIKSAGVELYENIEI